METLQLIEDLVLYAKKNLNPYNEDIVYARNQLCDFFGGLVPDENVVGRVRPLEEIMGDFIEHGLENGIIEEGEELRYETKLIGIVAPSPGLVVKTFTDIYITRGSFQAAQFLYNLSIRLNYIRLQDVKKNIRWNAEGPKGQICVTINLAKPEKDPKQVLAEKQFKGKKYPKCMLCLDNIGYAGSPVHPARQTLRIVPVELDGEDWHMQYSPYLYYDEHCIVFNDKHVPMQITAKTPRRLLHFTDFMPSYFLGSNADLPIVGGSILAHDHYQGGRKVLPMFKAEPRRIYEKNADVTVEVRDWYNSVISVKGHERGPVADRAAEIIEAWKNYNDESVGIISHTGDVPHNTVTPVATRNDGVYCVDLILRNNRTDEKHPFGIFHPTENMHNIKKESIGLIEAMGLFILPGRLKNELSALMDELQKKEPDLERFFRDPNLAKHAGMLAQIMAEKGTGLTRKEATDAVIGKVNEVCLKILECTAVFKNTPEGMEAFDRFMDFIVHQESKVEKPVPKKRGRKRKNPLPEPETNLSEGKAETEPATEKSETK